MKKNYSKISDRIIKMSLPPHVKADITADMCKDILDLFADCYTESEVLDIYEQCFYNFRGEMIKHELDNI